MLLIDCPYCGVRPELEFALRRPGACRAPGRSPPRAATSRRGRDFLYMRENTKGVHAERWRHTHGCGRFFNALRDTTTDHFLATYRVGEPAAGGGARARGEVAAMSDGVPRGERRAASTGQAAALHIRRPRLHRLRRRHARLGAARQRRASARALLQVPPAARHPRRRTGGAERARHRAPATPRA